MGILYLLLYLFAGNFIVHQLLPQKSAVVRVWLGTCLGVVLMMWLPALFAFFVNFSILGHVLALLPLLLFCFLSFKFRDKTPAKALDEKDRVLLKNILFFVIPLTILSWYLSYTHILRPVNGAYHVGQSTYGDLNLHLSIATSLKNAKFPANYAIFPSERLSYPFLTDSFSTSFLVLGHSLRASLLIPTFLLLFLTFCGYLIFTMRVAHTKKGAVLAFLLFFFNGGLGFVYMFDMMHVSLGTPDYNQLQAGASLFERLQDVMNGYYKTPVNHSEFTTYNLRWSNVIADMLIPQRTTLGGWSMLLPALYLLYDFSYPQVEQRNDVSAPYTYSKRAVLLLGIFAGALPMIHTHSYLALALLSLGMMVYALLHNKNKKTIFAPWFLYGALAALLSLPQLLLWTFNQTSNGTGFLTLRFNWVNNLTGQGLQDGYFWFYLKNIGLPFVLLLLSLFEKNTKRRFLASGAFLIFLFAECIQFQPNPYDNNKLFYVFYMIGALLAADYGVDIWERLKGLRSKYVIVALSCFIFFFSGTLSIARECVSDYQLFSKEEVETADFVTHNTDKEDVFMTYTQHINPVSSLAGRTIVCGPALWLSPHGFSISERENDIEDFYAAPSAHLDILEKYNVEYILLSSYERTGLTINYNDLQAHFDLVFNSAHDSVQIYKVRE